MVLAALLHFCPCWVNELSKPRLSILELCQNLHDPNRPSDLPGRGYDGGEVVSFSLPLFDRLRMVRYQN